MKFNFFKIFLLFLWNKKGSLSITDYGNLKYDPSSEPETSYYKNMKNYGSFMSCNKALIHKIPEILKENQQFLCLGGDHAIGFGRFYRKIKKRNINLNQTYKILKNIKSRFRCWPFKAYTQFVFSLGRCSCWYQFTHHHCLG